MHFLRRLLQCLFAWGTPRPRGDLQKAQAILTQAWSDCLDGSMSETHKRLTRYVVHLYQELDVPVYAQGELAPHLAKWGIPLAGATRKQDSYTVLDREYFGTYEVACDQKALCGESCLRIIVVQAVPATWRTIWVYERLGFQVIVPSDMPHTVFQKELLEPRWRRAITAYPYELAARLVYLLKGYI